MEVWLSRVNQVNFVRRFKLDRAPGLRAFRAFNIT